MRDEVFVIMDSPAVATDALRHMYLNVFSFFLYSCMHLQVLGGLALDGASFRRRKPLLLLAFLSLEGSKSRRELAELFWLDARNPRDSLSTAVRRLNADGRSCLVLDGDRLATGVPCDAVEFQVALRVEDPVAALEHYGGAFLDGLDAPLSLELEEWVFTTRERFAGLARDAHLRAAQSALETGEVGRAQRFAEDALDVRHAPPWEPEDLYRLTYLLHASGSPRRPEVDRAAQESGIEPFEPPPVGEVQERNSRLPHVANSFVGRSEELAHVTHILTSPDARLLTLHGAGGAGKSRLALEAAHRLFKDHEAIGGAYLVSLEEVREPHLIPAAIAEALRVPLVPQAPEDQQVVSVIGERFLLLLLDNVEHLAHDPHLLARILRECPHVRLLVTSRQRLHLPEEHVLTVEGLPVSDGTNRGDAIRLLLDRIRQGTPQFEPTLEDDLALHEVCTRLHGFPLALELAAAWTHILSLPAIAQELRRNLDLLETQDPTATERQRSLRATFEISWCLLSDEERAVLRRASAFRAGFRRAAAENVFETDIDTLAGLVDKALLRTTATGRFERHPLIHQYTREKLAEDPSEELEYLGRHAEYFLGSAARMGDAGMGGPDVKGAWAWFDEELPNIERAWQHALDASPREIADLAHVGWFLSHYGEQAGRFREVRDLYRVAIRGHDDLLDGVLLACAAWQSVRLGELGTAEAEATRAFELLARFEPHETWRGRWSAHEALMGACLTSGDFERGFHHANEAVRAAREEIDRHPSSAPPRDAEIALGISYTAVGWGHTFQGRYEEAYTAANAAYELASRHASAGAVFALSLRGQVELYSGDLPSARTSLDDALGLARRSGFESQEAQILCDLAQVHHALGEFTAAEASCRSGLAIARRNGNLWHETLLHSTLGRLLLTAGRTREALASFTNAARSGLAGESAAYAAEALLGLAQHEAEAGRRDAAAALLGSVACEPSVPAITKSLAQMLADTLQIEPAGKPLPMIVHLTRLAGRAGAGSRA